MNLDIFSQTMNVSKQIEKNQLPKWNFKDAACEVKDIMLFAQFVSNSWYQQKWKIFAAFSSWSFYKSKHVKT